MSDNENVHHDTSTPDARESSADMRRAEERRAGKSGRFSPLIVSGLNNLGNTCYFNSGIQILANCSAFLYGLWDSPASGVLERKNAILSHTGGKASYMLYNSLGGLFVEMEAKGTVTPAGALRSLREFYPDFEGPSQQDCAEMIGAVIGAIEDEGRINVDVETLLASFRKDTTTFSSETNRKPTVPGHSGRREPFNGSTAKEERKKSDYEYSLPEVSPEEPNDAATTHSEMFGEKTQSDIKMFEMMHTLNEKNAVLEKKSQERRGLPLAKRSAFVPPNIFFNSTTDGFKGYLMSEVLCHRCGATSGTIESFTALLLDIPTHAQRTAFAKNHPEIQRCLPNGQPLQQKKPTLGRWYNPLSWLSYLYSLFRYACSSLPPLTLEECLDIHFEPLKLSGSSKYHCESCGEVSDATKKVSILSLPEYLLFHMKRFDAGLCFDTKKTDSVSFPISWNPLPRDAPVNSKSQPEVLDLRHYLHPALAEDVALPPEGFRTSRDSTPGSANGPKHSSYTLSGVVTHSGSLSGGHYVASVFKKTDTQSSWVHISDDAISGSTATEVSQMEDYVLLYQKQPIMELSEEDLMLRDKARYYLSRAAQGAPDGSVYISRMWLHRMAFFTDPGPILNQLCYCNEEKRKQLVKHRNLFPAATEASERIPHVHGPPVEWMYIPIERPDFELFYTKFGGNLPVTEKEYQQMLSQQTVFIKALEEVSSSGSRKRH